MFYFMNYILDFISYSILFYYYYSIIRQVFISYIIRYHLHVIVHLLLFGFKYK